MEQCVQRVGMRISRNREQACSTVIARERSDEAIQTRLTELSLDRFVAALPGDDGDRSIVPIPPPLASASTSARISAIDQQRSRAMAKGQMRSNKEAKKPKKDKLKASVSGPAKSGQPAESASKKK
jgi:hypothetical protein